MIGKDYKSVVPTGYSSSGSWIWRNGGVNFLYNYNAATIEKCSMALWLYHIDTDD